MVKTSGKSSFRFRTKKIQIVTVKNNRGRRQLNRRTIGTWYLKKLGVWILRKKEVKVNRREFTAGEEKENKTLFEV